MAEQTLSQQQLDEISAMPPEQRLRYFINQVVAEKQVWILTDEHGAVMLTTEDEDCIPVWPQQEFAQMWATGEWQGFEPKAIDLNHWM